MYQIIVVVAFALLNICFAFWAMQRHSIKVCEQGWYLIWPLPNTTEMPVIMASRTCYVAQAIHAFVVLPLEVRGRKVAKNWFLAWAS